MFRRATLIVASPAPGALIGLVAPFQEMHDKGLKVELDGIPLPVAQVPDLLCEVLKVERV